MIRAILCSIVVLCLPAWAQAATYYLSVAGSNGNSGTSSGAPWLTWAYAFANSRCGDTLIVMAGTYTFSANGTFALTKVCTASTRFTVIAQNERAAFINGDGTQIPMMIQNAAFITVEGIRARSADLSPASGGQNTGVVNVYTSNNIILRRILASHPNRYRNAGHVIQVYQSSHILVEESEIYSFHRHGIFFGGETTNSVARRNYCNARGYADIPGSENPGSPSGGDDCYIVYPGSNNVFENNIAEGPMFKGFAVEALGSAVGNKFYGNISFKNGIGIALDARGSTATGMPTNTTIENHVAIDTANQGFRFDGTKNAVCNHCSAYLGAIGMDTDRLTAVPGDGVYSAFFDSSLIVNNSGVGFRVTDPIQTWTATNVNVYDNSPNNSPSSSANYSPLTTPTSTNPLLGTCRLWVPSSSPMKGAGTGGSDIGATILYRYNNGVLTKVPLWNQATGEFPHGAIVGGVNNVAGQSLFDVHKRLNVNTNGCSFPETYGDGGTDTQAPSTPRNLSIF